MGTEHATRTCGTCHRELAAGALRCEHCEGPEGAGARVDTPLRTHEVLDGKWRLEARIGSGGMGAVFLARDLALDRPVAIKILAAEHCRVPEFVTRFEREARALAAVEHPNIVPVYAVGRRRGRPFLVMKALEGQPLSRELRIRKEEGRRMGRSEILPLFTQLCAGLQAVHAKGLVHRDVKGGNVFLGPDGQVTLLDFGVVQNPGDVRITQQGFMVGTPTYASPEQVLGELVDGRSDLYAVGVLLFECLTLRLPFLGDPTSIMKQQVQSAPPDVLELSPCLPPRVAAVVRKALAKQPGERFQTAAELGAALNEAWPAPRALPVEPELEATEPNTDGFALLEKVDARLAQTLPVAGAGVIDLRALHRTELAKTLDERHGRPNLERTAPLAAPPVVTEVRKADVRVDAPEPTRELVLRIRPRRWPYAIGALLLAAALALIVLRG